MMQWLYARRVTVGRYAVGALLFVAGVASVLALQASRDQVEQVEREKGTVVAQRESAQAEAKAAEPVVDGVDGLCDSRGAAARVLDERGLCEQAARATDAPPVPPEPRGIASTDVVDGRLVVSYTDGTEADLGRVAGGEGQRGASGQDGERGQQGQPGRSIVGTAVVDGELVVTYSNGTSVVAGMVVGPAGRGVASMAITEDFRLLVTYSDGETADVGPLPRGPAGPTGPAGPPGQPPMSWTVSRADGSTETCRPGDAFDPAAPRYTCTATTPPPAEPPPPSN